MVEQKLSVRHGDEDLQKGNSEEADTVVAWYSPKLRSLWGRHRHSICRSRCFIVQIGLGLLLLLCTLTYSHPLHTFFSICIAPRPAGPWCPLYVTYVAFSLYHTPLQDTPGFPLVAVNEPPPNPYFSTYPPTIGIRLALSWPLLHITSLQHGSLTL